MAISRLSLALDQAGGLPVAGKVLVLRPSADTDLGDLPRDRLQIVTGFRPDHDHFLQAGFAVADQPAGPFAAAILFAPRARALGRALVAQAVAGVGPGAPIWIDGQKTDGIDSLMRDIAGRAAVGLSLSKSHGRCFHLTAPDPALLADWLPVARPVAPGFVTLPGVFSADGIDPGSALLAAHLPQDIKGKGADLGAGWGWLAAQVLTRPGVKALHLVEAEAEALACARRNVTDPRAEFHWADARSFQPGAALDFIVTNPPFHTGRAADPALGAAFLRQAAAILQPAGRLYLVANRTLPYEEALRALFSHVTPLAAEQGFKVICASHPRRARLRGR